MEKKFREIKLLGVRFHCLTVQDLMGYLDERVRRGGKTLVSHVNVRGMNFAAELPWYRDFYNRSDLVFCDGTGVLLGARLAGERVGLEYRMTCPDFLDKIGDLCRAGGHSLYLLGCKPGIAQKAADILSARFPGLRVGGHHGYFRKSGEENRAVVEAVNAFDPDILYVGFGMPAQEKWIEENFEALKFRVVMPLGACLEFYTGEEYRAPRVLTDNGLEWLSRLVTQGPSRVWGRYLIGNPLFLLRVLRSRVLASG